MRAIFFGTPEVARLALEELISSRHDVVAVVTQPDRPKGRSGTPLPSPVKERALEAGLPVLQPQTPKQDGFADQLGAYSPGVLAVVAYGHILPVAVLEVAPAINAHYSLLPRYRGAAPVQRAIEAGERETGVTTFLLEPSMDSGPIVMQARVDIERGETAGELLARLAPIGADLLVRSIDALEDGSIAPAAQDPALASPAPKVRPEDARIDWTLPADRIVDSIHAFNPSPGAWTTWQGARLKVWRAEQVDGLPGEPGAPAGTADLVHAGRGAVRLVEVQPEGGRRMTGADFARGRPANDADRYGTSDPPGGR
jgi:methionyl-tRNA formyltransferase